MADNNHKVEIGEDRLFELLQIEKRTQEHAEYLADRKSTACVTCPVVNERDELKAKVNAYEPKIKELDAANLDAYEKIEHLRKDRDELKAKLAAAERCIEDIASVHNFSQAACHRCEKTLDIIRAYRAPKEAK